VSAKRYVDARSGHTSALIFSNISRCILILSPNAPVGHRPSARTCGILIIQDIDKKSNHMKSKTVARPGFGAQDDRKRRTTERYTWHVQPGLTRPSMMNMFVKHQDRKRFRLVESV
jgi:hypothetical protein